MEFFHSFILIKCPFIATCQESCGKVMFSVTSVCSQGRGPMWPLTMPHLTLLYSPSLTHDTSLDRKPPPRPCPTLYPPPPASWDHAILLTPTIDICWLSLVTCSNLFASGHPPVLTSADCRSMYSQHKRAVCILLECFLVLSKINSYGINWNQFIFESPTVLRPTCISGILVQKFPRRIWNICVHTNLSPMVL